MIKKIITYLFVFALILVVYELFFVFLKTNHEINYNIIDGDNVYEINEVYSKKKKDDFYYLTIKNQDNTYLFSIKNEFNKQKEIVKKVNLFKISDEISCMVVNLVNKKNSVPICSKGNELYSYDALKNSYDLSGLKDYIKTYEEPKTEEFIENNTIKVNFGYVDSNEYIAVYNLKEILFFHNGVSEKMFFSDSETYKNIYGRMIGKYYLMARIVDNPDIFTYLVYDVVKKSTEKIGLDSGKINKDMYINGIYEDSLYIVDRSNKKQYKLNPQTLTIEEVGNQDLEGVYVENGQMTRKNIYELTNNDFIFTDDPGDYKSISYDIMFNNGYYAFYVKNNKFYKVYRNYLDRPILLFEANKPSNIKVINNNIYFLDGDSIYKYNEYGLNKIVTRDDFKYNSDNIYDVYLD